MHVLVLLHLYGESPEGLFKNTHLYTKTPIMAHARFMKLLDALGASEQGNAQCQSTWVAPEFLDPQFVEATRRFSYLFGTVGMVRGHSIVTIDDDKIRLRSKRVTDINLQRSFQRGGNPGPTQYAAVSIIIIYFIVALRI